MDEALLKLIDIVRDLNKSITMHIDNHNAKHVDDAIMRVGTALSVTLAELEASVKGQYVVMF